MSFNPFRAGHFIMVKRSCSTCGRPTKGHRGPIGNKCPEAFNDSHSPPRPNMSPGEAALDQLLYERTGHLTNTVGNTSGWNLTASNISAPRAPRAIIHICMVSILQQTTHGIRHPRGCKVDSSYPSSPAQLGCPVAYCRLPSTDTTSANVGVKI